MSLFVLIILGLIFYFIIWPVARVMWGGYKLHKRWKEATSGMRDAFNRQQEAYKQQRPRSHKKKIDPSVGEYVSFEEIRTETTTETHTTESGNKTVKTESQIEDAVWEEIS